MLKHLNALVIKLLISNQMSACQCIDIIHKTYNIYRDLTKSFWARKDKIAKFGFKNKIAKFCTLDKKWMNISSSTNTHRSVVLMNLGYSLTSGCQPIQCKQLKQHTKQQCNSMQRTHKRVQQFLFDETAYKTEFDFFLYFGSHGAYVCFINILFTFTYILASHLLYTFSRTVILAYFRFVLKFFVHMLHAYFFAILHQLHTICLLTLYGHIRTAEQNFQTTCK